jgi:NAD(P)-dependent dehydrogenase (short-subunit alcohol dehydrogenase family)
VSVRYGFSGQVAVITGAANGFGLAVAERLGAEGAVLVLVDRDADALTAAAAKLGGLAVVADVSVESDVDGYVAAAVADFDRVWAVNGRGVFMGLRAVLTVMKPRRSTRPTPRASTAPSPRRCRSGSATAPRPRSRTWWRGCCRLSRSTCPAPCTSSTAPSTPDPGRLRRFLLLSEKSSMPGAPRAP